MSIILCSCSKDKISDENEKNKIALMSDEELKLLSENVNDLFNTSEKYSEGLISYQNDGKYGFIDVDSNVVIPAKYDAVGCLNEGLVSVMLNNKMGYIDHQGNIVVPIIYDFTNYFCQGLAVVCKDSKWGYINNRGEVAIDLIYDNARDFFEPDGFAAVAKNGKEGLIDRKGNIVMPIQYEHAMSTQDGVATIFHGNSEISVYNDRSYKIVSY